MTKVKVMCLLALTLLASVACGSHSGATGTWITVGESTPFGTWVVLSDDGTYARETSTGTLAESENGLCLDDDSNSLCFPITIDGDHMSLDYTGDMIDLYRINPTSFESPQPDHELVGPWVNLQAPGVIDYLPSGRFLWNSSAASLVGLDEGYWNADGDIYCEVNSISHESIIAQAEQDGKTPPTWKGQCARLSIDDTYAEIGPWGTDILGERLEYTITLRRAAPTEALGGGQDVAPVVPSLPESTLLPESAAGEVLLTVSLAGGDGMIVEESRGFQAPAGCHLAILSYSGTLSMNGMSRDPWAAWDLYENGGDVVDTLGPYDLPGTSYGLLELQPGHSYYLELETFDANLVYSVTCQ